MSTTDEYASSYDEPATGWVGWIMFAAVFLMIIGAMNAIQGLAALFRDEAYWVTLGGNVLAFDVTTWGWIHLIGGLIVLFAGIGLFRGAVWARTVGVIVAVISAIVNFAWLPWYPVWSLVMIAIAITVIWALTAHGRDITEVE